MGVSKDRTREMRAIILLSLASLALGAPRPQEYSGDTSARDIESLGGTIQEIFGKQSAGGYGATEESGDLNTQQEDQTIDVLVQVVKEGFPGDYVEPNDNLVEDKATVEVDTVFEHCHEYTKSLGYECVPYYQCHNGTIITDGAGLIDIRNGFASLTPEDSKCPGFFDVCCKDPDFIPPPPPPVIVPKYIPQCGKRNTFGLGARIQGFTEGESQFGEWPHMCAVLHAKTVEQEAGYAGEPEIVNLYQCGGSLIAPGVVLTAAHCVDKFKQNPGEVKIRCGEWDTQQETEPRPHQDRQVAALEIHPEFDARNLKNDFAVLFTSQEFDLDDHIDTACLPQPGDKFDDATCFATGWGKDEFGAAGQYQLVMKEIDLPVVNHTTCQDKLRQTRLGQKFKLDESFVCAGGVNGKDTCKGDGGGPLVCPSQEDPDIYIQAGIVAWGIGCGEDGTPGVYADVSQAVCWIDQAVSCYYGGLGTEEPYENFPSVFGYTSDQCQVWLENKVYELEDKRDGAGKFGKIFQSIIDKYTSCHGVGVGWEEPNAPIIDPAPPRTVTDNGGDSYNTWDNGGDSYNTNDNVDDSYNTDDNVDDSYNTNDKLVDVEDSYNTNDKLVEVEDSYNTNEKIVDVVDAKDDSYNTNEEIVEAEDNYNTNDKIVEVEDNYNSNQKIVDQSAPVTCGTPPAAKITKG